MANGISENKFVEMIDELISIQYEPKMVKLNSENSDLKSKNRVLVENQSFIEAESQKLMGGLEKRKKDVEYLQIEIVELRHELKIESVKGAEGGRALALAGEELLVMGHQKSRLEHERDGLKRLLGKHQQELTEKKDEFCSRMMEVSKIEESWVMRAQTQCFTVEQHKETASFTVEQHKAVHQPTEND